MVSVYCTVNYRIVSIPHSRSVGVAGLSHRPRSHLLEKKLRQVRSVLTRDPRDDRLLGDLPIVLHLGLLCLWFLRHRVRLEPVKAHGAAHQTYSLRNEILPRSSHRPEFILENDGHLDARMGMRVDAPRGHTCSRKRKVIQDTLKCARAVIPLPRQYSGDLPKAREHGRRPSGPLDDINLRSKSPRNNYCTLLTKRYPP